MKIKLIKPAILPEDGSILPSSRAFQDVALPLLAALTPEKHSIKIVDEHFSPDDPYEDVDLVGISVTTEISQRAYQIARYYRDHGILVVLGGVHPTMVPKESAKHCDAVVIGEGERTWPRLLKDAENGKLRKFYRSEVLSDLKNLPIPRRELYPDDTHRKIIPSAVGIESTRGCPYDCEFCSVLKVRGYKYRIRPVKEIIREIETIESDYLVFVDDNMALDRKSAKELFRSMIPLNRKWISEGNASLALDPELLKLMKLSGCVGLQIGFESVQQDTMQTMNKIKKLKMSYTEVVQRFHDAGIGIMGNFVLGLDQDTPDVFEQTLEFALREKLDFAQFREVIPYPGTRLYYRLLEEGRLIDPEWWLNPQRKFGDATPAFRPRGMSPEQLMDGLAFISKEFYSLSNIIKRFSGIKPWHRSLVGLNLYFAINWIDSHRYRKMYQETTKNVA